MHLSLCIRGNADHMTATLTAVIEDAPAEHLGLRHEHGLAFHIAMPDLTLLFDCGASDAILSNAGLLNIDLEKIGMVAISHAHYDHAGGFRAVAAGSGVGRLLTGSGFFSPKYCLQGRRHSFLGADFDADFLDSLKIRHEICRDTLRLGESCWAVGGFTTRHPMETPPEKFRLLDGGAFVPDRFAEEICLAIRSEDGLAMVVGCAHPGIVSMVETVQERLKLPVRSLWGGTHLASAGPERLAFTRDSLRRLGVRTVGLCHCSGDGLPELLTADADFDFCRLRCGDGVFIAGAS